LAIADCQLAIQNADSGVGLLNRQSPIGNLLFFFFHLDGDAPTVETTLWAHPMWRARLSAVGTAAHGGWCQMIV